MVANACCFVDSLLNSEEIWPKPAVFVCYLRVSANQNVAWGSAHKMSLTSGTCRKCFLSRLVGAGKRKCGFVLLKIKCEIKGN